VINAFDACLPERYTKEILEFQREGDSGKPFIRYIVRYTLGAALTHEWLKHVLRFDNVMLGRQEADVK
jgi:hypothetical protein